MLRRTIAKLALSRSPVLCRAAQRGAEGEDAAAQSTSAQVVAAGNSAKTHVVPDVVLRDLSGTISRAQKTFLAASDENNESRKQTYSDTFFGLVNGAYEGRMQQQQQVEVEAYAAKRRDHYEQRLNEETEEFRRERREIHDELQRIECDKYKDDFAKDIADFTAQRQSDCESRLRKDVEKYHSALLSYRANENSTIKSAALQVNLTDEPNKAEVRFEQEKDILDFGPGAKGFGNDLTDADISKYVELQIKHYEKTLQEEIDLYTQRRRSFYEELIQAGGVRHAAKVRSDTEEFKKRRAVYYEEQVGIDAIWMAKGFQAHYERCVLSCYARQAWLMHRLAPSADTDRVPDISKITLTELNEKLPLSKVLEVYTQETIEEITRDVFLKAASRVALEKLPDVPVEKAAEMKAVPPQPKVNAPAVSKSFQVKKGKTKAV